MSTQEITASVAELQELRRVQDELNGFAEIYTTDGGAAR